MGVNGRRKIEKEQKTERERRGEKKGQVNGSEWEKKNRKGTTKDRGGNTTDEVKRREEEKRNVGGSGRGEEVRLQQPCKQMVEGRCCRRRHNKSYNKCLVLFWSSS
ncbi:hypothetical protein Pcinc_041318 [Petrolisthes cinctipes]|uniref:Uncharacterized protein n=1 Tax=Petrolisthes cinctipes TaxID=88211 RepID=A0AAE1BJU3_PETCI|nr:hypothetical protein Pcinc_041318 [Petrolisthes cinctipes]